MLYIDSKKLALFANAWFSPSIDVFSEVNFTGIVSSAVMSFMSFQSFSSFMKVAGSGCSYSVNEVTKLTLDQC